MIRLTASVSDIKQLAKKYKTTQSLVRDALTSVQYSIGLWSRWEEQIESDLYLKEDKRKYPGKWNHLR